MTTTPGYAFTPGVLYDVADAVLTNVASFLTAVGVDVPAVQYVNGAGATPLLVCEALIVSWTSVDFGTAGASSADGQSARLQISRGRRATLGVWMARLQPALGNGQGAAILNLPDEDAQARLIMADAYSLPWACIQARSNLRDTFTDMSVSRTIPIEPDGGIAGCYVELTVDLS